MFKNVCHTCFCNINVYIYTYITAHSALPHRRTTGKYTPGKTETPHLILFPNCVYVKPQLRPNWIPWTTFQLGRSCCLTLTQFGNSIAGQMWLTVGLRWYLRVGFAVRGANAVGTAGRARENILYIYTALAVWFRLFAHQTLHGTKWRVHCWCRHNFQL